LSPTYVIKAALLSTWLDPGQFKWWRHSGRYVGGLFKI
jgi:hypothetical protein